MQLSDEAPIVDHGENAIAYTGVTWEVCAMGIRIKNAKQDDRVDRMLADPKAYFDAARRRARLEVRREMAQERRRRNGTATA